MDSVFIPFPKIPNFKTAIKTIVERTQYTGMQDMGDGVGVQPTYDRNIQLPKVTFTGTVKLHGTNAAICISKDTIWFQSRNRILTLDKDNAGFAAWGESQMDALMELQLNCDLAEDDEVYVIFGEWCGGNIQPIVALQNLSKRFVPFETSMYFDGEHHWLEDRDVSRASQALHLSCVPNLTPFTVTVDTNFPGLVLEELESITDAVENECPYANSQGVKGIGEGVVWKADYYGDRYRFKVKGEKHAGRGKPKQVKQADSPEITKAIADFVNNRACTISRLEQAYQTVFDTLNGGEFDVTKTGDFLKWIFQDVLAEESEYLNGLSAKQVNGPIARISKQWLHTKSQEDVEYCFQG